MSSIKLPKGVMQDDIPMAEAIAVPNNAIEAPTANVQQSTMLVNGQSFQLKASASIDGHKTVAAMAAPNVNPNYIEEWSAEILVFPCPNH